MGKPFLCATYSATWVALSSAMASLDLWTSLATNSHAMPRALHKTPWRRRLQLPADKPKRCRRNRRSSPPAFVCTGAAALASAALMPAWRPT